jgi:hypothetical protein
MVQNEGFINMTFHWDGAPLNTGNIIQQWLNAQFLNKWAGRGELVFMLPCSYNLSPLIYFLVVYVKDKLYTLKVTLL